MNIGKIYGLYFSATGNTQKVIRTVAQVVQVQWQKECKADTDTACEIDITLPKNREEEYVFEENDFIVIGAPTYAGKLPNKILPFFEEKLKGNGAKCVAIVTYGNRSYDNALAELCSVLQKADFTIVGAAAMVGEHSFSNKLGPGRPNTEDLEEVAEWMRKVWEHVRGKEASEEKSEEKLDEKILFAIPGDAEASYYIPKQENGEPAVFLKAKPKTNKEKCTGCGACSDVCPMGSIEKTDPANITGVCIKCQACIKQCPVNAKYFDSEMFLSHVKMLELNYTEEKRNYYIGGQQCFQKN